MAGQKGVCKWKDTACVRVKTRDSKIKFVIGPSTSLDKNYKSVAWAQLSASVARYEWRSTRL